MKKMQTPFALFVMILFLLTTDGCTKKESPKQSGAAQKIHWIHDLDSALVLANQENKPLMIDFMAEWCPPCQKMEVTTFNQTEVIQKSASFVPLRIDVDKQGEIANKYNCNASKYGGIGIPNILFMTHEEKRLKHVIGYQDPQTLLAVMDSVLTMTQ